MKVFQNHKYERKRPGRTVRTCARCGVQNRTLPNGTRQWRHRVWAATRVEWLYGPWQTTNITCAVLEGLQQEPPATVPAPYDRIETLEWKLSNLRDDVTELLRRVRELENKAVP